MGSRSEMSTISSLFLQTFEISLCQRGVGLDRRSNRGALPSSVCLSMRLASAAVFRLQNFAGTFRSPQDPNEFPAPDASPASRPGLNEIHFAFAPRRAVIFKRFDSFRYCCRGRGENASVAGVSAQQSRKQWRYKRVSAWQSEMHAVSPNLKSIITDIIYLT